MRERAQLGTPFGADGPWLQAIVDALHDLHDLVDERMPARGTVRVAEPAPAGTPPDVVPVKEPAPDGPTKVPAVESEEERRHRQVVPPPRAGRGSGIDAWQSFADAVGVVYPADASRAEIIAACEAARVVPGE